ncbi:MAG: OsmC family protein [Chloroflexi bacterium]|nr:OsmC family protein [Chloroflexota bacterium]
MSQTAERAYRPIEVFATTSTIRGWRKEAIAGQPETGGFAIISDEGDYLPGGEGAAPTPLTYFVAGAALCLLSQVTQVSKMKKIAIQGEQVRARVRFHEEGSVLAGTKQGFCDSWEVELSLESEHPAEDICELYRLAHRMCFAEAALRDGARPVYKHFLNGQPLEI